jgi:hypothetical protein
LPVLGNLLALGKDPLRFFVEIAGRYGDFVSLNLAGWQALFFNDLPAIEKVLVEQHRNYSKHKFFWRHVTAVAAGSQGDAVSVDHAAPTRRRVAQDQGASNQWPERGELSRPVLPVFLPPM